MVKPESTELPFVNQGLAASSWQNKGMVYPGILVLISGWKSF